MKELKEIKKLLFDVLYQACGDKLLIDNNCIYSYEKACIYLEKEKMIEQINERIYKIKK